MSQHAYECTYEPLWLLLHPARPGPHGRHPVRATQRAPALTCRIHSWGESPQQAFINSAYGMIDYMTDRATLGDAATLEFTVKGSARGMGSAHAR